MVRVGLEIGDLFMLKKTQKITVADEKKKLDAYLKKNRLVCKFNFGRFGRGRPRRHREEPVIRDYMDMIQPAFGGMDDL